MRSNSDKPPFYSCFRPCSSLIFLVLFVVLALVVITLRDARTTGIFKTPVFQYSTSSSLPQTKGENEERIEKKTESDKINVTKEKSRVRRQHSALEKIEVGLARARSAIKDASRTRNLTSTHDDPGAYVPRGPIYRNANAFHRSYLEMERTFKIYVYKEGEQPLFHHGPCKSIYSTEGSFIHALAMENIYRTKDPNKAHVYFMPFSVVEMVQYLFVPNSNSMDPIGRTVADYVNVISKKQPYWNRSLGADHVMLSCHDWGPYVASYSPHLYNMSIRVLCNANTSEGFVPAKDVSYPEINLLGGEVTGLLGGPPPSQRPILAFFAGGGHGYVRPIVMEYWKEKDKDVLVYERLPKRLNYHSMMKKSKYCLCPSGYEVASPRVVEAIYSECVPVLISEGYIPPFSDVLNWESFSIQVKLEDIAKLKDILMSISENQYRRLQKRLKQVQRHFVVNGPPKRFDIFHMTVHSIWLRRLNLRLTGKDSPLTNI